MQPRPPDELAVGEPDLFETAWWCLRGAESSELNLLLLASLTYSKRLGGVCEELNLLN